MRPWKELFEAMTQQRERLGEEGEALIVELLSELTRQALRRQRGCPDEAALERFVNGQMRGSNFWRWLRVWLHVRVRRCRYCRADGISLIAMHPLTKEGHAQRQCWSRGFDQLRAYFPVFTCLAIGVLLVFLRVWQQDGSSEPPQAFPVPQDRTASLVAAKYKALGGGHGYQEARATLEEHVEDVTSITLAMDGRYLALKAFDKQIMRWNRKANAGDAPQFSLTSPAILGARRAPTLWNSSRDLGRSTPIARQNNSNLVQNSLNFSMSTETAAVPDPLGALTELGELILAEDSSANNAASIAAVEVVLDTTLLSSEAVDPEPPPGFFRKDVGSPLRGSPDFGTTEFKRVDTFRTARATESIAVFDAELRFEQAAAFEQREVGALLKAQRVITEAITPETLADVHYQRPLQRILAKMDQRMQSDSQALRVEEWTALWMTVKHVAGVLPLVRGASEVLTVPIRDMLDRMTLRFAQPEKRELFVEVLQRERELLVQELAAAKAREAALQVRLQKAQQGTPDEPCGHAELQSQRWAHVREGKVHARIQ
jgi:hypothetical protein